MNTLEIFSTVSIFLLKYLSQGEQKFQLTIVTYIKEVRSHRKAPQLEINTIANTSEKRLELCRDGFKHIQKYKSWAAGEEAIFFEGTAVETWKVYILKEVDYNKGRALAAFKCPTDPESYIHINLNSGYGNKPAFEVFYKKKRPRPGLERLMYQTMRVTAIVEVDTLDMISALENKKQFDLVQIPVYDTEELTEEQRIQICLEGIQTVPKLNIELLKGKKTRANKYYNSITTFSTLGSGEYKEIMEAFECPTVPKIYISVGEDMSKIALLWVLIRTTNGKRLTTNVDNLGAHSSKKIAEASYHRIRNANKGSDVDQIIDLDIQTMMCQSIFKDIIRERRWIESGSKCRILSSIFFPDTYDLLKKENKKLFERYYKNSASVFISGSEVVIVNGPESTDVVVPEGQKSVPEDVFVCLIRSDRTHIEEYFVSKEYNMNFDLKNSYKDYKAGRFFFKRNPENSVVSLMGMVEEFAKSIETANLELLYLKRRKKYRTAETESDDPLCKLESSERERVCSLVSQGITHKEFKPTPLHYLGCAKNQITFASEDGLNEANGNQYYEWMITCYESASEYGSFRVYYLSQAYDKKDLSSSNNVFLYNRQARNGNIYLQNEYSDPRIGNYLTKK